ncbi:MAG TPA: aminodeoxychorismate synthase component I [Candidatus Dormibacteraeota bacterium]|jgi:para-aminobenzoate synthetase|nr:aminodeoxychorismate synthase component I [Candidatus Dormibacteraeota bacterium]
MALRTLLVDNHDSFTYNLFQLLEEVNGCAPVVLRNDDRAGWRRLRQEDFDAAVISPGPGRPDRWRDLGISAAVIAGWRLPMLGVCLGHQAVCHLMGGRVGRAPEPVHGRVSRIRHRGEGVLAGLPDPFVAVRYHSLVVHHLPPPLEATAWTEDGLVMALRHRHRPIWGVQFHPESIASEGGRRLLCNFRALAERPVPRAEVAAVPTAAVDRPRVRCASAEGERRRLLVRRVPRALPPEQALPLLFGSSHHRFWLDRGAAPSPATRFSYFGGDGGPLAELVTYDASRRRIRRRHRGGVEVTAGRLLDWLGRDLDRRFLPAADLPFDFNLGYVGYLGYELKGECGGSGVHQAPLHHPDAALMLTDRMVAYDHVEGCAWVVSLATPETLAEASAWASDAAAALRGTPLARATDPSDAPRPLEIHHRHRPEAYRRLVETCLLEIARGESYEICLTNMLSVAGRLAPWSTYRTLRSRNPAPHAALLQLAGVSVLSSSPELFLRISADGEVESRPIKGTSARHDDSCLDAAAAAALAASEKDRAENLMIVDLVRNDLTRACSAASVHVPELFAIESHATVHQLVSTVRGRLHPTRSTVDAIRACFPGGSMTGAPKIRTMEIIDRLEGAGRGVYSGALGSIALGGAVDLGMVIRTIVLAGGRASVGAGGAIVAQSDPDREVEEMLLKAQPMLETIARSRPCR